jgi:hypothetical protein
VKLKEIVGQASIDPQKLISYALNPKSLKGADKAFMFEEHLGFTQQNYQFLLTQIRDKIMESEAVLGVCDEYGQRYQVDMLIDGVEFDQQEIVRMGWIVKPSENISRLVTAYVRRRK